MSGSSYGGAVQFATAAIEPRRDVIVPDAAWHSLVDSLARAGAFKRGWLLDVCVLGEVCGLLDGVTGGLAGPGADQIGSVDPHVRTMCLEGNLLGSLSAATKQWLTDIGPGALLEHIRTPTLITHGTVDTLFAPGEAIAKLRRPAPQWRAGEDDLVLRRPWHVPDAAGRSGQAARGRPDVAAALAQA
jgi:ABC-2 type transport system ATP-binding protein